MHNVKQPIKYSYVFQKDVSSGVPITFSNSIRTCTKADQLGKEQNPDEGKVIIDHKIVWKSAPSMFCAMT